MRLPATGHRPISFMANIVADPCALRSILTENGVKSADIHEDYERSGYKNPHPKYSIQHRIYRSAERSRFAYAFDWCVKVVPSQNAIIQSRFGLFLDSDVDYSGSEKLVLERCLTGGDSSSLMLLTFDLTGKPRLLGIIGNLLIDLRHDSDSGFSDIPDSPEHRRFDAWRRDPEFKLGGAEREGICIPSAFGWSLIQDLVKYAVADVRAKK